MACIRRPQNHDDHGRKAHSKAPCGKNKIITKPKTNDKKCARINLIDPRPRARSEIQNDFGINPCWWCRANSRAQLRTLDEEERAAKIVRGLWTSFCFCLCISFCNSLLLLPNVALFFFLCFFSPSSLHVIHSVFLRSFLSFFLSLPLRSSSSSSYFSFFLFNLVAIVRYVCNCWKSLSYFRRFSFFVKLKIQIEDQQEDLCFFFFAWRRSEGERRERTVLRNLWRKPWQKEVRCCFVPSCI